MKLKQDRTLAYFILGAIILFTLVNSYLVSKANADFLCSTSSFFGMTLGNVNVIHVLNFVIIMLSLALIEGFRRGSKKR